MSENLMFALLGFLTACLLGTVCASFLWRRAVIITTRRIVGEDQTGPHKERAGNSASDQEVAELRSKIASRDAQRSQTETAFHKTAEDLRVELTAAWNDQEVVQAALQAGQEDLTSAKNRINTLETAIQTLAETTGVAIARTPEPIPGDAPTPNDTSETGVALETAGSELANEPVAPEVAEGLSIDKPVNDLEGDPTIDVTRSLEERIEALKQGQPTH